MRTLGALGIRNFRRALGRSLLTAAGVTLGVALLFGVLVANDSSARAFAEQIEQQAHPIVAVVGPTGELPGDALGRLAALPDVFTVHISGGFQGRIVSGEDAPPEPVWISGTRRADGPAFVQTEWESLQDDFDSDGPLPGTNGFEISISRGLARRLDAGLGSAVEIETPTGRREATVSQIWWRADGGTADDPNIITSMETARRVGGDVAKTGYAAVRLRRGTDVEVWLARHRESVGTDLVMTRQGPSNPQEFRRLVRLMEGGFAAGAGTAVFVGAFLIFLTLSLQVAERAAVFGTLRALGAHRWQVARIVLAEGAVLGVVATAAGLVLGFAAAMGLNSIVAGLYRIDRPDLYVAPRAVILALVVGVGVTVAAALLPAWRASRHDPITSMRRRPATRERIGRLWMVGAVALAIGTAWSFTRDPTPNDPGLVLVHLGAILVLPPIVAPLARVVGRLTRRAGGSVGDIGVLHLVKERTRAAYTMGLIMIVLATVLTLGTVEHTYRHALDRILDRTMAADLAVNVAGGLDDAALSRLSSVDGVDVATAFRGAPTVLHGHGGKRLSMGLGVIDPATYFDALGFPWVDGNDKAARDALSSTESRSVILTDSQSRRLGVKRGETVDLETTQHGLQPYRVVGIISTLDPARGAVIGLPLGRTDFAVGPAYFLRVRAEPGVPVGSLEDSIQAAFPDKTDMTFIPQSEERANAASFMNRYFAIFLVVILVALVVGMLGLANTLALAVFRRTRELGVMRAVGTHRRQLGAMVAVEALTLTAAAAVVAVPLGALDAYVILRAAVTIDIAITYAFDWLMVPVVAVIALILGSVAAVAPARRAARVDPVVALRFE